MSNIHKIQYTSMEMQDEFVHLLIGDSGTFLDIGSADPYIGNNTATLESIGWTGVAFDFTDYYSNLMNQSNRSTPCFCVDVTQQSPFIPILTKFSPTKHFNYISLDVDFVSTICLQLLIENGFTFDVMTFEHNAYLVGDEARVPSREILHAHGYKMLFEDVKTCKENWSSYGPMCNPECHHQNTEELEWEDWWIGPNLFENLKHYKKSTTHQDCLKILRNRYS